VLLVVTEFENDGDVGLDFDRLGAEEGWAIAPLADGVQCGVDEERVAAQRFQRGNGAVAGDDGVKLYSALNALLTGDWGVEGFDAADEHRGLDALAAANDGRGGRAFSHNGTDRWRGVEAVVSEVDDADGRV